MNKRLKQLKKRICAAGMVIAAAGVSVPTAIGALPAESVYAAGDVEINATNFPDENFRKYVSENIDENGDGKLSEGEINGCTEILSAASNIKDHTGIEHFTALEELNCGANPLSSLDVSKNTALKSLICNYCNLSSIDVSGATALETLICADNSLSTLDVSRNTKLEYIYCDANPLSSLDISKNTKLEKLYCSYTNLSSLDVSKNTKLEELFCGNNNLKSLDVSRNTLLQKLECRENNLSSLDVSKNTVLWYCDCYSQIRDVIVSDNEITLTDNDPQIKADRISNVKGAVLSGGKFTNIIGNTVTYDYDTGLAKAPSGKLYYVTKGKYNTKYNGKAVYNNKQYTVVNGRVK